MAEKKTMDKELRIANAIQHWHDVGHPELAASIERSVEEGKEPNPKLMNLGPITPERVVNVSEMEIPPRAGKGSSKEAWAEFAAIVSDMEPEILGRMSRDDIVLALEAKGVIPKEG